jgi:hypothetical protein
MTAGEDRRSRASQVPALAAHRRILEQHMELRRLLALGLVQTCMPTYDQRSALPGLVGAIGKMVGEQLSDEGSTPVPLLEDALPGESWRLQRLHEARVQHRRDLHALRALSPTDDGTALANRFDSLARRLLVHMADEERALTLAVAALDERAPRGCAKCGPGSAILSRDARRAARAGDYWLGSP